MTTTSHTTRSQHSHSPNPDSPTSMASGYQRPGLPLQQIAESIPPETNLLTTKSLVVGLPHDHEAAGEEA